ncbi:MarR family winged helix-turn-helix transcriptional regulator [Phycicoccus flavus]|uniref:MarR family winged helix-turn-helix transcriptional regulator n=1 Tax=Phycicoccus flavus TaxID=2502783 RepID=UPI000FEBEBDE|nr:MarR family transcriptional regulator [Phycicoccus flavus]NHA69307.1 MarR family transcriptional regulator [Phycicoccus flavus]
MTVTGTASTGAPARPDGADPVDAIVGTWGRERPDLDATPMLVVGRLARAEAAVDAALRPPFAAAGLASGDFDVLAALRRQGEPYAASPSALAAATLVTQGATTKRVDRLARQGLVTRTRVTRDGRSREVRLTARGVALVDRLIGEHLAREARLLAGLTGVERDTLARLLLRLTDAADAMRTTDPDERTPA